MRLSNVETVDYPVRAIHQLVFIAGVFLRNFAPCVLLTAFDKQRSQFLNRCKEFVSNLFFQHLSEQTAKRADITTQRRFFKIAVVADELSQPRCLIVNFPEWFPSRHACIPQFPKINIITRPYSTQTCGKSFAETAKPLFIGSIPIATSKTFTRPKSKPQHGLILAEPLGRWLSLVLVGVSTRTEGLQNIHRAAGQQSDHQ